jgi:hypothetical protein
VIDLKPVDVDSECHVIFDMVDRLPVGGVITIRLHGLRISFTLDAKKGNYAFLVAQQYPYNVPEDLLIFHGLVDYTARRVITIGMNVSFTFDRDGFEFTSPVSYTVIGNVFIIIYVLVSSHLTFIVGFELPNEAVEMVVLLRCQDPSSEPFRHISGMYIPYVNFTAD